MTLNALILLIVGQVSFFVPLDTIEIRTYWKLEPIEVDGEPDPGGRLEIDVVEPESLTPVHTHHPHPCEVGLIFHLYGAC